MEKYNNDFSQKTITSKGPVKEVFDGMYFHLFLNSIETEKGRVTPNGH